MHSRLFFLLPLLPLACSSSSSTSTPTDTGITSLDSTPSDTLSSDTLSADTHVAIDAPAGARTIDNCTTDVSADAPAFFRTYFRCVTIITTADAVVITTDDLPPHLSYYYGASSPNYATFDVRGGDYHPNPNKLKSKKFSIKVPKSPVAKGLTITSAMVDGVVGTSKDEFAMGQVGVALDAVAVFNPLAAPGDDIATERFTFDEYDAHPAPDGVYHYHTSSKGPLEVMVAVGASKGATPGSASVELFGVMCDGTIVFGCTELDGSAPTGTLDAQGGHVGDIKDAAGAVHFAARYHTHVCPTSATGRKFTPEIQYYSSCGL